MFGFLNVRTLVLAYLACFTEAARLAPASDFHPGSKSSNNQLVLTDDNADIVSTHRIVALGSTENARVREDRAFRHTGLQPTGLFISKGASLSVVVPPGVEGLKINIVLFGNYSAFPDQPSGKFRDEHNLRPGANTVVAGIHGFVHVVDEAAENTRTSSVMIQGGQNVPTFERGKTDERSFRQAVSASQVPFGVLIGDRVMVEIQKSILDEWLANDNVDITARIGLFDDTVDETDRVFGLSRIRDTHDGAYKGPHKLHVTNPDTGVGYASATQDRITFQKNTKAMIDLLTRPAADMWGFWHEVGHTYQPAFIKWSGMTEVTVNIASIANWDRIKGDNSSRLEDPSTQSKIEQFFAQPNGTRQFDSADIWVKLLLFDQLTRAFGRDFYARFAQEVRVNRALGEPAPASAAASKDAFAMTAAKITNRNLNPWLDAWGFGISANARAELEKRQTPRIDMAANRNRSTDKVEAIIPYSPPSGTVRASGLARLGQRDYNTQFFKLEVSPGPGAVSGQKFINANEVGTANGTAVAEFTARDGQRNVAYASFNVRRGTMVEVRGIGDRFVAAIAIMDDGKIETRGAAGIAHGNFPGHYFSARLMSGGLRPTLIRNASMTGLERGQDFASRFSGLKALNGYYLVVEHEEPKNRLKVWSEDTAIQPQLDKKQVFLIRRRQYLATLTRSSRDV